MDIESAISLLEEPRMITPGHTSRFIEALVEMTGVRSILELGMYTGYTTLHVLRALKGVGKIVSIDCDPMHDPKLFSKFKNFEFMRGRTPECLSNLHGQLFDLVFIDSDHSVEHTAAEVSALWPIVCSGSLLLFHDAHLQSPLYGWLEKQTRLKGLILSAGPGEDLAKLLGDTPLARPNLGVFRVA